MGTRLLPRNLDELFAHALTVEREATKRFAELERFMRAAGLEHVADEFEAIGREEREQYEALALGTVGRELPSVASWEYAAHYLGAGAGADAAHAPRDAREALMLAIAFERRTQLFYVDVAEHTFDDTMCAFAAEMAADESRHIARLERLLAREPDAATPPGAGDRLPLKA